MSESPLLTVDPVEGAEYPTVSVSGELDLSSAPTLRARLEELIDRSSRTVLDCAGLTFVDSSGLSALLTQTKLAREAGGSIALANVPTRVARVFALAGLDGVFDFYDEPNATGATTA